MENMENNFKPKKEDNITVEYHGELMENFFSESTIDSGQGLRAIKYKDELAMLLFIDKQQKLRLVIQIDDSASGWSSYDLSPDLLEVSAFDIYHNEANNILKIAYARVNNNSSQLLLSDNIELSKINPLSFTENLKWNQVKLNNVSRKIDHISMNQSGLLFSTAYREQDATYSYFRYGEHPQDYTLPENTPEVIQLEVGQFDYEFGTFLLYEMKGERSMIFQSFPDEEYGEVTLHRFKPCDELCGFTTADDRDGNDQLYVSGDGIFAYKMEEGELEPTKSVICESGKGVVFSKIEVSCNDKEIAIWSIGKTNGKSGLYYLTNRFYETADTVNASKWTAPLQMQDAIEEFSSIKGNGFTNQLFLLGSEDNANALIHFWQDEETSNWHEHPVVLENLNKVKQLETFTVNVRFKCDEKMLSFYEEKAKISAEANLLVYIDGKKVAIGPQKSYEVTMEGDYINIVYSTKSIAASRLYVEADFLPSKVTIDPAHKLKEKIKVKFGNKDTLKNAKLPNGESLIDSSVSDNDLEQIVSVTNKVCEQIEQLDGEQSSDKPSSVEFSTQLAQPQGIDGAAIALPPPQALDFSYMGNPLGDIWHALKKGFVAVTEFIAERVEDGIQFIIKIGNKIWKWVSKNYPELAYFLERVWEKIKVGFNKAFKYLAFLFDWQDILDTKDAFRDLINNGFEPLKEAIGVVKEKVTEVADELKVMLNSPELTSQYGKLGKFSEYQKQANEIKKEQENDYSSDPRFNWIGSKKEHLSQTDVGGSLSSDDPISQDDSLFGILTELGEKFVAVGKELENNFVALINDRVTVGEFLKVLVEKIAAIVVEIGEQVINALLTLVQKTVDMAKDGLNAEIKIPFFTALYKKIDPNGKCCVLDILCLIIAVPFTALYKDISGKAPLEEIDRDELTSILPNVFSGLQKSDRSSYSGKASSPQAAIVRDELTSTSFDVFSGLQESNQNTNTDLLQSAFLPQSGIPSPPSSAQASPSLRGQKNDTKENWLKQENSFAHWGVCILRLVRVLTYSLNSYKNLILIKNPGQQNENQNVINGFTVIDYIVRLLTVCCLALTDEEIKPFEYAKVRIYFAMLIVLFCGPIGWMACFDPLIVTILGFFGCGLIVKDRFVDSKNLPKSVYWSRFSVLWFQIPAIGQYLLAKSKMADWFIGVWIIRSSGMLISSISEGVVAREIGKS